MTILLRLFLSSFTLFLYKAGLNTRASRNPHAAASKAVRLLIFTFAIALTMLIPTSLVQADPFTLYKGKFVNADGSGYFQVANVVHINVSKFFSPANRDVFMNVSNKIGTTKDVTLSFGSSVEVLGFWNGTVAVVNVSISPTNESNDTSKLINSTLWTRLNLSTFNITLTGITFKGFPPGNKLYKYSVTPKIATGTTEYSIYFNTSILGNQVWVEFDPITGINTFNKTNMGFAKVSTPCCNGAQVIGMLNDGSEGDAPPLGFVQTGEVNQNPITMYINLTQGQAINKSIWESYSNTYEPTDYNISGSNDNVTWTLLKSVVGNTATTNITDDFVNQNSYLVYVFNITRWNDGVSTAGGLAVWEWYGYNDTIVLAGTFPTLQQNFSNITTFRKGNVAQFGFNLSDNTNLSYAIVEHNMTADGVAANITIPINGTAHNVSANITILFGNTTNFYVKPFFNDSSNQMNNTVPRAFYTTSNTAPIVPTISTPTAASYNTTNIVTWAAVGDVDNNTATYRVYVNGTFNGSTTTTSLALNMTSERTYAINLSAFDSIADSGNSTQVQFVFDNLAPLITLQITYDTNATAVPRRFITLNTTITEPFLQNLTAALKNGTNTATTQNTTGNNSPSWNLLNFTSLGDDKYNITVTAQDNAGNLNNTFANISIIVDTTPPAVDNGTNTPKKFITTQTVLLNYSWTEANNGTFFIRNSSGGTTTNTTCNINTTYCWYNFTGLNEATATANNYTFSAWINDTVGNVNTTNNITVVVDITTPTISNATVDKTTLVAGNPFVVSVNRTETWTNTTTTTIAGANYTMTCTDNSCTYTFTTTPGVVGDYIISKFYINDMAGNTAENITSLSVAATGAPQAGSGTGGGGGGGGGLVVVTANGTTIIVTEGNFSAKPSEIDTYDAYYPNLAGTTTWSHQVTANSPVKNCVTATANKDESKFFCEIEGPTRTDIKISKTYTHNSLAQTYEGTLTLISDKDNVFKIPVKVTSINFGLTIPISIPLPSFLTAAITPWAAKKTPEGKAQLRWWTLLLIVAGPSVKGGMILRKRRKSALP